MPPSPDALQHRLEQLEADVQRWQRTNRFWVWGLLTFIAVMVFYNTLGRPWGSPRQMLTAQRVALVDAQGQMRALLGLDTDESPFLRLESKRGTATLGAQHDGTVALILESDGQVVGQVP